MTEDECSDSRPHEIKLYYPDYNNAEIDAELLRDLLDVAAVQRCEGLTAPETYEVLQDEPSDELMARLKAIVKRELKQD